MNTYQSIIVDDEQHAIDTLSSYIKKSPNLSLTGSYDNPLDALKVISGANPPDIAFLDIDMPELSGLSLAGLANQQTQIIFVSAHEQYAIEAFELHPGGYLLKPFSLETFLKTVTHVCGHLKQIKDEKKEQPVFLKANSKGRYVSLVSSEIMYMEAMGNYVKIHKSSTESPQVIYNTLKGTQSKITDIQLIQVNRATCINTWFIQAREGNRVILKNGHKINIGPLYRQPLLDYLNSRTINS